MASIRLPEDIDTRLQQLATLTQRSKSFFVKEALAHYLEEMEDAYLALERIAKPRRRFYSSAQVLKEISAKRRKP